MGKCLCNSVLISEYSTSCTFRNVDFSRVWDGLVCFVWWFTWLREYTCSAGRHFCYFCLQCAVTFVNLFARSARNFFSVPPYVPESGRQEAEFSHFGSHGEVKIRVGWSLKGLSALEVDCPTSNALRP